MLIKVSHGIKLRDIEEMLSPIFVLQRDSGDVYELIQIEPMLKICTLCGEKHNTNMEVCIKCNRILNQELRWKR